jgi:PAS domain S-box-containing protein
MRANMTINKKKSSDEKLINDTDGDHYEQLQSLTEFIATGVLVIRGQKLVYANPAAESLTGFNKRELLNIEFNELFSGEGKSKILEWGNRYIQDGYHDLRGEFEIITKSGNETWIDLATSPISFKNEKAVICTLFDITEHKRGELLQDAVYRIAIAADQSKDLDGVFSAVHGIIAEVMNADNFYIALYDEKENLLSFPYFVDEADLPPKPAKLGKGLTEYVLRSGKSQLVDLALHNELCNLGEIELIGVPSPIWLGVPLIIDSSIIGVMVVQNYSDPKIYGEREKQILEFVSSQVAKAINRKRVQDALIENEERYRRRADELAALYETGQDLATQQDMNTLLGIVAERILKLMKSQCCTIYLFDEELNEFDMIISTGSERLHGDYAKLMKELVEKVAQTLQPLIIDNYQTSPEWSLEFGNAAVTAAAVVPIKYGTELVGMIAVYDADNGDGDDEKKYSLADVELLTVFADTAAVAVNNARLFKETQQRLLEIQVLYQISLAAKDINSIHSISERIVETLDHLLNWQNSSIWVIDPITRKPNQIAHSDEDLPNDESLFEKNKIIESMSNGNISIVELVCSSGQPVLTGEIDTFTGHVPERPETKSVLCVPLNISGKTIGCINVENRLLHYFGAHDQQILSTLAAQAASAIENANLYREAIGGAERRSVLHQASQEIARSSQDPEEVYLAVHKAAIQLMPADGFGISLFDELKQEIRGVYLIARGERYPVTVFNVGQGLSSKVINSGKSVSIPDFQESAQEIEPIIISTEGMTRSVLAVPMRTGERITGIISVQSYQPNTYIDEDQTLLEMLAAHAGAAIENARLFEETRRRAGHQAVLNSIISVTAHAGGDPAEILSTTLEQTLGALELDSGSLWLSWSARGSQRLASKNIPASINSVITNSAMMGGVSQTQPLIVDDWRNIKHKFSELFLSSGIYSTIMVPLLSKENRIGGMAIASKKPHHWTAEEIDLLEAIGREVGSTAERAKLFEETTIRLDELTAVNKVSKSLRLAQTLQEMLPLLMDETLKILDVTDGGIWLINSERRKLNQVIGRGWCKQLINLELDLDESLPGKVLTTGDIYFSHDVVQDSLTSHAMRSLVPEGCSAICLPIHSEQVPIGVLFASTKLPREFTIENAHLLVTLTEIAGNAIHRTRLNEQMVHNASELEIRVTERTAELQSALLKAQAADHLKSEFIINVNHELRTPLTNLILYYQMLRTQPNVKSAERLEVIGRELQRLRTLIEELLNLSRFDLGQIKPRFIPCDINSLIQTLINDRRSLAEERRLTINSTLEPNLDSVWIDEPTITQAISNLLTNSMNYTPGGGSIEVSTMKELRVDGGWVGIRVKDTGRGIDENDLPHIFERFYRGKEGHDSGAPGTGLGLAIVKQVLEIHHGKINVENDPIDHGAIFTIWLPEKQPQEAI